MMSEKLRAAAQEALEWLKDERLDTWTYMDRQFYKDCYKHTKALAAALAEPTVQESLTVAEPIGWVHWLTVDRIRFPQLNLMPRTDKDEPLYTAPPRREWVGLTAEDMADAHNSTSGDVMMRLAGFARAIETKLRIKNGY